MPDLSSCLFQCSIRTDCLAAIMHQSNYCWLKSVTGGPFVTGSEKSYFVKRAECPTLTTSTSTTTTTITTPGLSFRFCSRARYSLPLHSLQAPSASTKPFYTAATTVTSLEIHFLSTPKLTALSTATLTSPALPTSWTPAPPCYACSWPRSTELSGSTIRDASSPSRPISAHHLKAPNCHGSGATGS